jgi:hypothetical protein
MSDKYLYHYSAMESLSLGTRYFSGSAELDGKIMTKSDYELLIDEITKSNNANEVVILNLTLLHEPATL